MSRTPLLASLALALSLGTSALAQSPLCSYPLPWASNNGGTAGGVVFFDLAVSAGVLINAFDCNCSGTTGSSVTLEVYTTPNTYSGNETNSAAWTLVATAGPVLSAARNSATTFTLSTPLALTPGNYGIGFRVIGSGQAYTGTGTGGTPVVVSTAEMTFTSGAAISAFFTGTYFSIRTWNGCIHYTPAAGLYPSFTATPLTGASPMNVAFTDTTFTSDPNGILSWVWDFENDGTPDAFVQNPTHTYTQPGVYSVKLSATDTLHGTQNFTRTNYISVDPVTANFTGTPTLGTAPLAVNFTDTSTGLVTAWAWDFDNDGITDSTLQNPTWLYINPGQYTVKLTVSNSGQSDSETKINYVFATGTPVDPGTPDVLQYQFNEPRGSKVANSAIGSPAPAFGTVVNAGAAATPNPNWQGDPGRLPWQGNEAGFGCLGIDNVTPYENRVDSGWTISLNGSHTIAFWTKANAVNGSSFPYAFGSSTGSGRCYMAGTYMSLRNWGTLGSVFLDSATDPDATTNWTHWAAVIDNAAGTAQWYVNGIPDGAVKTFPAGTFTFAAGNFIVGDYGTSTTAHWSRYFLMDDFRVYGRALSPVEILGCMLQEKAAATTFGAGCAGPGGVPTIGSSGGVPFIGNASFQIDVGNTEVGAPCAVTIGVFARTGGLPLDISFLLGAGCLAENLPDLGAFVVGIGPTGSLPLGIPPSTALAGAHLYAQALVFGTQGAASPGLDINLQN